MFTDHNALILVYIHRINFSTDTYIIFSRDIIQSYVNIVDAEQFGEILLTQGQFLKLITTILVNRHISTSTIWTKVAFVINVNAKVSDYKRVNLPGLHLLA